MKNIAKIISVLFHPVFIPFVVSIVMFYTCPQFLFGLDAKAIGLWKIQIGLNTILYPLLVTFLIWKLGFTKDVFMRTNQERLGPLMATILFYFWNFYVFHKERDGAPIELKAFLFGTFLSVSFLFLTTIFTKISMHTTAIAGAATALLIYAIKTSCVNNYLPFAIAIIIFAMVIWARLYLKEHTIAEIVVGSLIGIICQVGAWFFYIRYFSTI